MVFVFFPSHPQCRYFDKYIHDFSLKIVQLMYYIFPPVQIVIFQLSFFLFLALICLENYKKNIDRLYTNNLFTIVTSTINNLFYRNAE
jgi:hypothetical protein